MALVVVVVVKVFGSVFAFLFVRRRGLTPWQADGEESCSRWSRWCWCWCVNEEEAGSGGGGGGEYDNEKDVDADDA